MVIYKRYALLILIVLISLLLAWNGWQNRNTGTGLVEIQQRGVLRVGLDASFPPFEFLNADNQMVGLDADIARAMAADLGVDVAFVNMGFDGLYDALSIERVDVVISGLPVDPFRTREVAYSVNYFNAGQALIARRDDVETVDDLAGKSLAVEWGSMADMEARRLIEQMPSVTIQAQPDVASVLQADLAIVDGVTALQAQDFRLVNYLSDEWYAAAVKLENRALLAEINRTLRRLQENAPPPCNLAVPHSNFDYPDKLSQCYAP